MSQQKKVIQPTFMFAAYPRNNVATEKRLADQIGHSINIGPEAMKYFATDKNAVQYLPIRQKNGSSFYQERVDGVPKLFYMFGLPKTVGSFDYYDDPQFMFTLECEIQQDNEHTFSIRPKRIHTGTQANFIMGISYPCCETNAVTYLAHNAAVKGDLRRSFATSGLRPDIMHMWNSVTLNDQLTQHALDHLQHLALDISGKCNHNHNPAHAQTHANLYKKGIAPR